MCGFSLFFKQYCIIAPRVLASVYALATTHSLITAALDQLRVVARSVLHVERSSNQPVTFESKSSDSNLEA